jgi:nitrite reductase/ring-hydroxylating ferredoxin subunit
MSEFVVVCKVDDVPVGEARQFKVNGTEIALARVGEGECYAIGGRCTHLRAKLGNGELEGTALTCPWHGSQFEVTTGKLLRWVQEPLFFRIVSGLIPPFLRRGVPSYEVKVEDGQVLVKL